MCLLSTTSYKKSLVHTRFLLPSLRSLSSSNFHCKSEPSEQTEIFTFESIVSKQTVVGNMRITERKAKIHLIDNLLRTSYKLSIYEKTNESNESSFTNKQEDKAESLTSKEMLFSYTN